MPRQQEVTYIDEGRVAGCIRDRLDLGWRVAAITNTRSGYLIVWELASTEAPSLSAAALACLAASPNPDVQAEATALIAAALVES